MTNETAINAICELIASANALTYQKYLKLVETNGTEPVTRSWFNRNKLALKKIYALFNDNMALLTYDNIKKILHECEINTKYVQSYFGRLCGVFPAETVTANPEPEPKKPKSTKKYLKGKITVLEKELDLIDEICELRSNEANELQETVKKLHEQIHSKTEHFKIVSKDFGILRQDNSALSNRIDEQNQMLNERDAIIHQMELERLEINRQMRDIKNILSIYESNSLWQWLKNKFKK